MYYEMMSHPTTKQIKREFVLKHKEQILQIVEDMLKKDAPIAFDHYDIYKDSFTTFAQDIIEKYTLLHEPNVEYITEDCELIDKHILLKPKTKTIVEIMKKYSDNV
jgi:hypothetical protein